MQFNRQRRRAAPAVIIVSLIDVLIVVLIFLMVTTTFKQLPSIKLILPESTDTKAGGSPDAVSVTIEKNGVLYFKTDPVPYEKLEKLLKEAELANPKLVLTIRADSDAPWGQVVKVRDAAKAADIKFVRGSVKSAAQ